MAEAQDRHIPVAKRDQFVSPLADLQKYMDPLVDAWRAREKEDSRRIILAESLSTMLTAYNNRPDLFDITVQPEGTVSLCLDSNQEIPEEYNDLKLHTLHIISYSNSLIFSISHDNPSRRTANDLERISLRFYRDDAGRWTGDMGTSRRLVHQPNQQVGNAIRLQLPDDAVNAVQMIHKRVLIAGTDVAPGHQLVLFQRVGERPPGEGGKFSEKIQPMVDALTNIIPPAIEFLRRILEVRPKANLTVQKVARAFPQFLRLYTDNPHRFVLTGNRAGKYAELFLNEANLPSSFRNLMPYTLRMSWQDSGALIFSFYTKEPPPSNPKRLYMKYYRHSQTGTWILEANVREFHAGHWRKQDTLRYLWHVHEEIARQAFVALGLSIEVEPSTLPALHEETTPTDAEVALTYPIQASQDLGYDEDDEAWEWLEKHMNKPEKEETFPTSPPQRQVSRSQKTPPAPPGRKILYYITDENGRIPVYDASTPEDEGAEGFGFFGRDRREYPDDDY